jgi:predicted nucleotidyltransferase
MISQTQIMEFVRQIAEKFSPEKIILFGSYAYGQPTQDSDVDLLIVMDYDTRNVEKAIEIDCAIRRTFPMDLFVRRPADIASRLAMNDWFIRDIIEQGKLLYEGHNA